MKKLPIIFLPVALSCLLTSCGSDQGNSQVISKRYIHKFGYAVTKEDWEKHRYPGQVITTLRDGITITANYENGLLHGPCTHTYPHSQTVHHSYVYNQGNLVKELTYDMNGMPLREKMKLTAHRYTETKWYPDGTPMSIENYAGEELLDGEYLAIANEVESRVEHGNGQRILHNSLGALIGKDQIVDGYMTKRETFYPSGALESNASYQQNKLHGEKKTFAETGEPISIEEWSQGMLHGKATYFTNGIKQREVYFLNGEKNGPETHYIDGEKVLQEILWSNNKRHGPTKFYIDGIAAQFEWFYNGEQVSQKKFDELNHLDKMITQSAIKYNANAR